MSRHGQEGWAPLDESGGPRGVCNCLWRARTAVTGLASSQEVREWLEMVVLETFPETTQHDVAVAAVLHALGGGE